MKQRYHILRRENGIYYSLDTLNKKRESLKTTDAETARRLIVDDQNEACKQPAVNLQIAQVYLQHSDPDFAQRTGNTSWTRWAGLKPEAPRSVGRLR